MKKLLLTAAVVALVLAGCAVTDYPIITDTRGDYSGIIRTGHKAYIVPTSSVATFYPDGSDELFSMVFQNQYGDQKIYTFNNFDPTGTILFLDQTYCDWQYEGCEIAVANNPANSAIDQPFDYAFYPQCSGARSLSMLVTFSTRVGECGDGLMAHKQDLFTEFANLPTTSWRGETAYLVPISAANLGITLTGRSGLMESVPVYGAFNAMITDDLQFVVPMTPNARHQLRWLADYAAANGTVTEAVVSYGSLTASLHLALAPNGLEYNLSRF